MDLTRSADPADTSRMTDLGTCPKCLLPITPEDDIESWGDTGWTGSDERLSLYRHKPGADGLCPRSRLNAGDECPVCRRGELSTVTIGNGGGRQPDQPAPTTALGLACTDYRCEARWAACPDRPGYYAWAGDQP